MDGYPKLEDVQDEYVSTQLAAHYLSRSDATLRLWIKTGRGPITPIRNSERGPYKWPVARIRELISDAPLSFTDIAEPDVSGQIELPDMDMTKDAVTAFVAVVQQQVDHKMREVEEAISEQVKAKWESYYRKKLEHDRGVYFAREAALERELRQYEKSVNQKRMELDRAIDDATYDLRGKVDKLKQFEDELRTSFDQREIEHRNEVHELRSQVLAANKKVQAYRSEMTEMVLRHVQHYKQAYLSLRDKGEDIGFPMYDPRTFLE